MFQNLKIQNCPIHESQQIGFIDTESNQQQPLKCSYCIVDEDNTVNISNIIPIGQIIEENNIIINNWPIPKNKQLTKQLKKNLQDLNQKTIEKEQINQFFSNFREQLTQKIDELEQKFIEVEENTRKIKEEILKKYNQYSAREDIKDIIFCQSLNIEQKNTQISEIINKIFSEQLNINKDFSQSFEEINAKNLIDFEAMNLNQKYMLDKLSTIQQFLKKDETDQIQTMITKATDKCLNLFGNQNFDSFSFQTLLSNTKPSEDKLNASDLSKNQTQTNSISTKQNLQQKKEAELMKASSLHQSISNQNILPCGQFGASQLTLPQTPPNRAQPLQGLFGAPKKVTLTQPSSNRAQSLQGLFGAPKVTLTQPPPNVIIGSQPNQSAQPLQGGLFGTSSFQQMSQTSGLFGTIKSADIKQNKIQEQHNSNQSLSLTSTLDKSCFDNSSETKNSSQKFNSTSEEKIFTEQSTNTETTELSLNQLDNSNTDNEIENIMTQSRQYKIQLNIKEIDVDKESYNPQSLFSSGKQSRIQEEIGNIPTFNLQPKIKIFFPKTYFSMIRYGILTEKLENKSIHLLKLSQVSNKNQIAWLLPEIDEQILIESFKSFYIYDFIQNKLVHQPKFDGKQVSIIKLHNNVFGSNQDQIYKVKQNIQDLSRLLLLTRQIIFSEMDFIQNIQIQMSQMSLAKNKSNEKWIVFEEIVLDEEQFDFDWKNEFSKHYQQIKWV